MKELKEIVKAYDQTLKLGRKMALASVIHVEGSSYRRAGARMLVDDEGNMTGAISGGCLEGDALRKAQLVIAQQDPKLISYDTSDEEDISIGVQLGCAGVIQVLFEPIAASHGPIGLFKKLLSKRQKSVLVTLYNADKTKDQYGTCLLLEEDGQVTGQAPEYLEKLIKEDARKVLQTQSSSYKQYQYDDNTLIAFLELIPPPTSLFVIGAGNDAIPLVNIGNQLGWDVRVVDGRSTHARPDRFQGACQVLVSKPELILDQVQIDEHTAFVLMTHNYNYDLPMLKALLQTSVAYIGVLGPKKKLDRMFDEIIATGMEMTDDITNRIFGPVGLEIGAETSDEIALSIIAEVKAVLSGKSGSSLRDKPGSIHAIYHS